MTDTVSGLSTPLKYGISLDKLANKDGWIEKNGVPLVFATRSFLFKTNREQDEVIMKNTNYLSAHPSITEACEWLRAATGEIFTLSRLIEYGLMPYFWLDYTPEAESIFLGRVEGYMAPMCFVGDTKRLAAHGGDVLVTHTRSHDGRSVRIGPPGLRFPTDELRFMRTDIEQLAADIEQTAEQVPSAIDQSNRRDASCPTLPGETVFSKSQICAVDWGLPDKAPKLKDILNDRPQWLGNANVSSGAPGRRDGTESEWGVVALAAALACQTSRKKWVLQPNRLTAIIQTHFPTALPYWEEIKEYL